MDIKVSLHQKAPSGIENAFHSDRKKKKPLKPIMAKAYRSRTHKEG